MRDFILRLFINAVALTIVAMVFPGIHFRDNGIGTLVLVALILGLLNATLKPFMIIMSCPLVVLTLGLWALVINGLILLITDEIAGGRFEIDGFWTAFGAGIVISIIAIILENALGVGKDNEDDGNVTILSQ